MALLLNDKLSVYKRLHAGLSFHFHFSGPGHSLTTALFVMQACRRGPDTATVIIGVLGHLLTTISEAIMQLPEINYFFPARRVESLARQWIH